jgi:hypothetical protein
VEPHARAKAALAALSNGSLSEATLRRLLDRGIDRGRFELDRHPALDYQPLPWLGIGHARREIGVATRWEAISPWLEKLQIRTAVDLGCNVGYFPIAIGLRGIPAIGVEQDPRAVRLFRYAIGRLGLEHVGALNLKLTPQTVQLLPTGELTIFLSLWHHLVRAYGLDQGLEMLRVVWSRSGKAMVFETGESEMPPRYGLPDFGSDPERVITDQLLEHCPGAKVECLGEHAAFDPTGRACRRHLFLVACDDRA